MATVLCTLVMAILPAFPVASPSGVRIATTLAASGGWLDRLNSWRASTGLPSLIENSSWSAGDYNHALYMVKNDLVTHYETPGVPYYTPEGDTAARNSNIQVSSTTSTTDEQTIDWWMQAPFHAMGLMDPRLTQTGFGSYREVKSGWQEGAAVDTLRGNSFTGGQYPVFFPGNGATEPLTSYNGQEFPDPLQACPGYSAPSGLPVFVQVGGNVATTAGPVHSFTGNGAALEHCVIDSTNPSVGSNLTGRGGVIVIPRQPLQSGVKYVVALTVNGVAYTWSFTVGPFASCASVTATAAPPFPVAAGTTVTFTGTAAGCTNPNPLYQFWLLTSGSSTWQLAQAYSTNAAFHWISTGAAATVSVWVRDAASPGINSTNLGRYDAFVNVPYAPPPAPCASVTASATPPSPSPSGTAVTITGVAAGCPNPSYEFWMLGQGSSTWQLVQGYSTNTAFHWNSTGALAGTTHFSVWARDASSPAAYDTYASIPYTVTSTAFCATVTASAAPPSPSTSGTPVTITGVAAGCPNPNPLYEFWMLGQGSSTWQLVQGYSTGTAFHWNSTGALAGISHFSVWVRDASSPAAYDTYASIPYTVTNTASCASVTDSAAPPSPSAHGTGVHVTITGVAAGCTNPNPLYEFWMLGQGSSTWQLVQGYSTLATFNWNTTGALAGNTVFSVWVRDAGSTAAYDVYGNLTYTLS